MTRLAIPVFTVVWHFFRGRRGPWEHDGCLWTVSISRNHCCSRVCPHLQLSPYRTGRRTNQLSWPGGQAGELAGPTGLTGSENFHCNIQRLAKNNSAGWWLGWCSGYCSHHLMSLSAVKLPFSSRSNRPFCVTVACPWITSSLTRRTHRFSVFVHIVGRVGFVVCREPGRISLYVALPPSRPQPIGSRKQLEPRSRSAVHRDENFVG